MKQIRNAGDAGPLAARTAPSPRRVDERNHIGVSNEPYALLSPCAASSVRTYDAVDCDETCVTHDGTL